MKKRTPAPEPSRGSVQSDELLPLSEFLRRLGIGRKSWYSMRDAGLRSVAVGKQVYILGADVLDFFRRQAKRKETEK